MLALCPKGRLGVPAGLAGLVLMLSGCGEPMQEGVPEVPKDPPCEKGDSCAKHDYYNRCPDECTFCGNGQQEDSEGCDNKYNGGVFNDEDDQYFNGAPTDAPCKSDCTGVVKYCGDATCQKDFEDAGNCKLDCPARCGDGVLSEGEECDDGNLKDTDSCRADCLLASCGDGVVQLGVEECDDANVVYGDACAQNCKNAICGDGFVRMGWEECDDANDVETDGCNNKCGLIIRRKMFVSSTKYSGNLGGIDGADAKCQVLAKARDPKLPGNFKAWLSDAKKGPVDRFDVAFTGVYELVDTTIVAVHGWKDLSDGMLDNPINIRETCGSVDFDADACEPVDTAVWSNTNVGGSPLGGEHCDGWSTEAGKPEGSYGLSASMGSDWTGSLPSLSSTCSSPLNLYCIEDPV